MNKYPEFEQSYYSKTTNGKNKVGYDIIRLIKCVACYDRSSDEIVKYYDLMVSILTSPKEIPWGSL